MELLYENKNLEFICNSINLGLIENIKDIEISRLIIKSNNKPNIFIKLIDIDISNYVKSTLETPQNILNNFQNIENVKDIETNFYDYIIFTINEGTIMCISLLEMLLINSKLTENNSENFNEIKNGFNTTDNIWNLYIM